MQDLKQQRLVSDLDRRLNSLLKVKLSERAAKLFKFIWRCELDARQTDVTAAIAFLDTNSRRPAYNAIHELEKLELVHRVVDQNLRRRKLLRVTRMGWEVLATMSGQYSDIILDHVKRMDVQKTNWVEYLDSRPIDSGSYSPSVDAICDWAEDRGADPIPAKFLSRVFVLDCEKRRPESFVISYWGRGMLLQGGRDFSGHKFAELKKCSSVEYWRHGIDQILDTLDSNCTANVTETRMSFGGKERGLQRVVIPDRVNSQVIIGTWFVDTVVAQNNRRKLSGQRPLNEYNSSR